MKYVLQFKYRFGAGGLPYAMSQLAKNVPVVSLHRLTPQLRLRCFVEGMSVGYLRNMDGLGFVQLLALQTY
ncbi:hypothetical protein [Sporosarcina sp.]|uniref:hypothetical protein n=1 Tax=Sporosarcina sp. TaxID=49982 RepID=UPI002637620E|nr:hypothetical protein [Sporosarcina sp.]